MICENKIQWIISDGILWKETPGSAQHGPGCSWEQQMRDNTNKIQA